MNKKIFAADVSSIDAVTDFVNEQLEIAQCPMKAQIQLDVAIDEIFSNIAHYAYENSVGDAAVGVEITDNPDTVVITFEDSGIPYNPLAKPDPDVTLSAEEREIGGLGIFMVKKSMDDLKYEYRDGKNIFTIIKNFNKT